MELFIKENMNQQPKKSYVSPSFHMYGSLQELTKSGMGSKTETNPTGQVNKRP